MRLVGIDEGGDPFVDEVDKIFIAFIASHVRMEPDVGKNVFIVRDPLVFNRHFSDSSLVELARDVDDLAILFTSNVLPIFTVIRIVAIRSIELRHRHGFTNFFWCDLFITLEELD